MTLNNDDRIIMIKRGIEKALEGLKDSEIEINSPSTRVNRAYYCAFNCANVLLLTQNIERDSHKGVLSEFGRLFVKTGEFPEEFGRYLRELEKSRYSADYSLREITTKEKAEESCKKARLFYDCTVEKLHNITELFADKSSHDNAQTETLPVKKLSFAQRQRDAHRNEGRGGR